MNSLAVALALPLLVSAVAPVEVVVDAAMVDDEALARHLDTEVRALLAVLPRRSATPLAIGIDVSGELLDFEVRLRYGPGRHRSVARCRCTRTELVTHVLRRVARVTAAPVAPPAPVLVPSVPKPRPRPVAPPASSSGLGPLGRAGAGLSVLGGFALGTGVGVWGAGRMSADERFDLRHDARPIGAVAVVVGACIGLSGALLLAYGRHSRRTTGVAP